MSSFLRKNITLLVALLLLAVVAGKTDLSNDKEKKQSSFGDSLSDEQVLQSYGSFLGSLISTTISEIGDKTFIMTAILSSKYNRAYVFVGSVSAMLIMTFISCFIGSLSEYLLPLKYVKLISSLLFFFFGAKMLYEVYTDTVDDEDDEAEEEIEEMEKRLKKIVAKPKTDDDQDSSEASSPEKKKSEEKDEASEQKKKKKNKHAKGIEAPAHIIIIQTFVSNFFGEWGDKSQISTVAISASYDFLQVFFGTIVGQTLCTLIALAGGQLMAKKFSEKTMALLGGILFLVFGAITLSSSISRFI